MAVHTHVPQLFELSCEDTRITYAPSAFGVAPRLHYAGPLGTHIFEGDEIQTFPSARGLEIRVALDRVSHLRTITLTMFVPDVELDDEGELSFRTIGIQASRRRSMTGGSGARMTSEPLEFDGLVRNVRLGSEQPPVLL